VPDPRARGKAPKGWIDQPPRNTAAVDERHRELAIRGYAAVNRGDVEAALEAVDPSMELVSSGAFLDQGVVYRGHEGVRQFFAMLGDAFEEISYEPKELIEVDEDRLLVILRLRGRGKESGLDVELEGAHLWTIRDLKAVRLETFVDARAGRAAAGLT
jgi:ketosteroid isomerase-like protein